MFPEEMTGEEIEVHFARNGEETAKELRQEKTKEDGNMNIKQFAVEEKLEPPKKADGEKNSQVKEKTVKKKRKKEKLKVGKVKKVIKKRKKSKEKIEFTAKPSVEMGRPRIPLQEKVDKPIVKKRNTKSKGMNGQNVKEKLVQKKLPDFMRLDKAENK